MRQTISGLVAAIAVMSSAAPAMACGATAHAGARVYVAPVAIYSYSAHAGCGGWVHERLPDPEQQYYYVNQGPTYTGPGNFAPCPVYQEELGLRLSPARQLLSRPRAALLSWRSVCCAATTDFAIQLKASAPVRIRERALFMFSPSGQAGWRRYRARAPRHWRH